MGGSTFEVWVVFVVGVDEVADEDVLIVKHELVLLELEVLDVGDSVLVHGTGEVEGDDPLLLPPVVEQVDVLPFDFGGLANVAS